MRVPVALRINNHGEVKAKRVATSPGNPRHARAVRVGVALVSIRSADAGAGGGKKADRMLSRRGYACRHGDVAGAHPRAPMPCAAAGDGRRPTGLPVARSDPTTPRLRGTRLVFRLSVARPRGRRTGRAPEDVVTPLLLSAPAREWLVLRRALLGPGTAAPLYALWLCSGRRAGQRAPVSSRCSPLVRDSLWRQVATHSLRAGAWLSRSAARLQARSSKAMRSHVL